MWTSYSAAFGRISFSAKSCASSRNARCSSVSEKDTPSAVPCSAIDICCSLLGSIDRSVNGTSPGQRPQAGRPCPRSRRGCPPRLGGDAQEGGADDDSCESYD